MKAYTAKVNISEALRYLGFPPELRSEVCDDAVQQVIRLAGRLEKVAEPRYVYRVFDISNKNDSAAHSEVLPEVRLDFINSGEFAATISSEDAGKFLKDCKRCILLAVTIGHGADKLIRQAQVSDMAAAVIMNACAGSLVENLCNQINDDLEAEYGVQGLFLTDRFSPGYGDFPLVFQESLCSLLNAEKSIGITCTDSCVLIPSKSITAVIGISDNPQPKYISGCANCNMKQSCKFRKDGTTCAK